jgi:hypothetical protein
MRLGYLRNFFQDDAWTRCPKGEAQNISIVQSHIDKLIPTVLQAKFFFGEQCYFSGYIEYWVCVPEKQFFKLKGEIVRIPDNHRVRFGIFFLFLRFSAAWNCSGSYTYPKESTFAGRIPSFFCSRAARSCATCEGVNTFCRLFPLARIMGILPKYRHFGNIFHQGVEYAQRID